MVKKKGIVYCGYDSASLPEIDSGIRDLVCAMNRVPYIVTYDSCQGHHLKMFGRRKYGELEAFVGFEVYDEAKARRLFRKIARSNWIPEGHAAWIDINREYHNVFCFNDFDLRPPIYPDRLVWTHRICLRGRGYSLAEARKNLNVRKKGLIGLLEKEVRRSSRS